MVLAKRLRDGLRSGKISAIREILQSWRQQLAVLVISVVENGSNSTVLSSVKCLANQAEILEDIFLDALRSASKSYPDEKAQGIDHWSSNFIATLPNKLLQGLRDVLNCSQLFLCWPVQLMMNLITLIPKQQGGQRPIAKTPLLYRLWNRIRSQGVKQWAAGHVQDFDFAAAQRSAVYSGAIRCWTNELAVISGRHTASLLWDLEKFFDTITPEMVLQQGLELGYPPLDLTLAMAMHTAPRMMTYAGATSSVILPNTSILAGCSHSNNFARLVMTQPMLGIERRVQGVRNFIFVDDVAQSAIGKLRSVAESMVHAGILFASKMKSCRLRISHRKSVVVSSDPADVSVRSYQRG